MTRLMMPSKLYSALSSGTPILGIGEKNSHLAEIVVENGCGWFFDESETEELITHLQSVSGQPEEITEIGNAGRELAVEQFSRGSSVSNFNALVRSVMDRQQLQPVPAQIGDNIPEPVNMSDQDLESGSSSSILARNS